MRDMTLCYKLCYFSLSLGLPFCNIWSLPHIHRTTAVYQGADSVVITSCDNQFLVFRRSACFSTSYKAGANPNAGCTIPWSKNVINEESVRVGSTHESAAASPRPSAIPPAATTMTGSPVKGLLAFLQRSTVVGIRIENGVSPVWPPPSPPCAQMMSTPRSVLER